MEIIILKNADRVAATGAELVSELLGARPDAVLGLATGSKFSEEYVTQPTTLYVNFMQKMKEISHIDSDPHKVPGGNN